MAAKIPDLHIFFNIIILKHIISYHTMNTFCKFGQDSSIFKLARCKKPEFWAIFSIKSIMAAKKRDLEKQFLYFFYLGTNDGQYVKFHDCSIIFKLARCKKPEFWAIFSEKSKMAAKKRDLEK